MSYFQPPKECFPPRYRWWDWPAVLLYAVFQGMVWSVVFNFFLGIL